MGEDIRHISSLEQEIFPLEQVQGFLLNSRIFGSYLPTNTHIISYLEAFNRPFTLLSLIQYIELAAAADERAQTLNRKKCAVKKIVAELIAQNPERWSRLDQFFIDRLFRSIKTKRIQTKRIPRERYLTPDEVDVFLKKADRHTQAIILFLITTGCRVSELTNCRRSAATVHDDFVDIVVTGKGNKERHVQITKSLWTRIERLYQGHDYLFCTRDKTILDRKFIYKKIQELSVDIINRKIGPHVFRHSFAMMMLQNGKDLKAVSDYLGHAKTELTADMYIHTTVKLEEIPDFEKRLTKRESSGTNE